ncbi:MAG: hypothetical protein ABL883_05000 [Terricaulis sp.]
MRTNIVALLAWLAFAPLAPAIPIMPMPEPIYEAPIERALDNVAAMDGLELARREQLLGRLNLLAYARNDAPFTYVRADNRLILSGSAPCEQVAQRQMRPDEKPDFGPGDRCAGFEFHLGPQPEILASPPATPNRDALARLYAARAHYARAVGLDRADLRSRLGYAYTLDRSGHLSAARQQLRIIIRLGLPLLAAEHADWETHAVLTEAAEHLSHVARSAGDRARVAQLRDRLARSQPVIYVTPMLVPLSDRPFAQLIDRASSIAFDFAGTGDRRAQGWLTPDAAWLVWDPRGRGQVRSGFDMIGQRTWAVFWSDGFQALRALDDNRDGELTGAELGGLALWRDLNGNGVSDSGEVTPAQANDIAALSVRGRQTRPGLLTAPAGVRLGDGTIRPLYDWTPSLERETPVS